MKTEKNKYITTTGDLLSALQELPSDTPLTLEVNGHYFMDDFELQVLTEKNKEFVMLYLRLSSSVKVVENDQKKGDNINLQEFRRSKGIAPNKMADILCVSHNHYSALESEEKHPSYQVMTIFKQNFPEASIDEIFFGGIRHDG